MLAVNGAEVPLDTDFGESGGMTVVTQLRRLGDIALAVDADGLERARMQVDATPGTPAAAPIPTATSLPTATAVPTPTPVPPTATSAPTPPSTLPEPPVTGGSPVPFEILLALVGVAVLMIFIGVSVLTRRGEFEEYKRVRN